MFVRKVSSSWDSVMSSKSCRMLFGGVVDENVEPSKFLDDLIRSLEAELAVAHIALNRQAPAALLLDQSAGLLRHPRAYGER